MLLCTLVVLPGLHADWKWQNPLPQGNQLFDMHVFDGNHFIAVGEYGTFVETKDGGNSWTVLNGVDDVFSQFHSILFTDPRHGWILGGGCRILEILDQGYHLTSASRSLQNVRFIYVAGRGTVWVVCRDSAFVTGDNGASWKAKPSPSIAGMHFVGPDTGFAYTDENRVLKTEDGGATWTELYINPVTYTFQFKNIYFSDEKTGWIFGADYFPGEHGEFGCVLKTTDGGKEWKDMGLFPGSTSNPLSACFFDDRNAWAGFGQYLYHTEDGGVHWSPNDLSHYQYGLLKVLFATPDTGFVLGNWDNTGVILRSTDHGLNWSPLSKNCTTTPLVSVCFADTTTGYAGGRYNLIVKTTDGGRSWQKKTWDDTFHYDDIAASMSFIDGKSGWIMTNRGYTDTTSIFGTADGGDHWEERKVAGIHGSAVKFFNRDAGVLIGKNMSTNEAKVLKTYDGGITWIQKYVSSDFRFYVAASFPSEKTGYVSADGAPNASLLKTVDGGESWVRSDLDFPVNSGTIFFADDTTGWIGDSAGGIHKTSDGGVTWRPLDYPHSVNSISFSDRFSGCVVGMDGYSATTRDGGENWLMEKRITGNTFTSVVLKNSRNGWAVGQNGMILKYSRGEPEIFDLVESPGGGMPAVCRLLQNWPNPFNSRTSIDFYLPKGGNVRLSVLDIRGREIKTLLDETRPAGYCRKDWDGSDRYGRPVATGVYLSLMKFENAAILKKMIFMK